jgi:hypothetical protein
LAQRTRAAAGTLPRLADATAAVLPAFGGHAAVAGAGPTPRPVPFSRLTLTAQLAVLAQPVERSWNLCAPLNPHLPAWRERAQAGDLQPASWPKAADRWLNGEAYARKFARVLGAKPRAKSGPRPAESAQAEFIRRKLKSENLFPLLWARQT